MIWRSRHLHTLAELAKLLEPIGAGNAGSQVTECGARIVDGARQVLPDSFGGVAMRLDVGDNRYWKMPVGFKFRQRRILAARLHGQVASQIAGLDPQAVAQSLPRLDSGGVYLLNRNLGELSHLYASLFQLHYLGLADSFKLLIFPTGLGWFGAWVSVGRHLALIDAELQ